MELPWFFSGFLCECESLIPMIFPSYYLFSFLYKNSSSSSYRDRIVLLFAKVFINTVGFIWVWVYIILINFIFA